LLANLISYPVTWFLVPSLGRFRPMQVRQLGIVIAFMSRKEERARRVFLVITLALQALSVIVLGLCFILTSMARAYGSGAYYAVAGLPPGLVILFAELFAVGFEALLLWLLARKTLALSFPKAALISLLMNAASYVAGLALDSCL